MRIKYLILICFALASIASNAQVNVWNSKANFAGSDRQWAVAFSIGSKGYLGTGTDNTFVGTKDFWEYDQASNTWTQKADFAGTKRFAGVGFSIGSKGYIGTGLADFSGTQQPMKDIWEYDPTANTWTQKTDLPGSGRYSAASFVNGSKAYVSTGLSSAGSLKDIWEFDPAANSWTQKTNFPGAARGFASGFSVGTKGYMGLGSDDANNSLKDFYEFDPSANTWTKKADFAGSARFGGFGFAIGTSGFITAGADVAQYQDTWKYNPSGNSWTQKADLPAVTFNTAGFVIGNKAYVGTGAFSGIPGKLFFEYVAGTDQTITFNALPAKAFGDAPFALSATASSGLTVTFSSSNTSVATISGNTVTIVGTGSTVITANQSGDATFDSAPSVTQTLNVGKADQTITFGPLPTKALGDSPFTLTASVTSGLPITFASSNTAVATISGNTVTIVNGGITNITASQAGDATHNAATPVVQSLTVTSGQTITFNALPSKTIVDSPFDLSATASSGLAVSYSSSNTSVATISGSTVTIVSIGQTDITASQAGNSIFTAAAPVTRTLTVTDVPSLQDSPGQMWGMSTQGGIGNIGVLFKTNQDGTGYTTLKEFKPDPDGASPKESKLVKAANGKLYGMTTVGGVTNGGVIFEYDPATSTYIKKAEFTQATGYQPVGSLVLNASGTFYGVTYTGGANFAGTVFEYDPVANLLTKKADMSVAMASPAGSITAAANGKYYGSCFGGDFVSGGIYEFDPATSTVKLKYSFNPAFNDGNFPHGGMTLASNGKLYGTCSGGGANQVGTLFEFDPLTSVFVKKYDFTYATVGTVYGDLFSASNNKIYGASIYGGTSSAGVIFELNPSTGVFAITASFTNANGGYNYSGFAEANGKLYGVSAQGGTHSYGCLYELDLALSTITLKHQFVPSEGNHPSGAVTIIGDKIYGATDVGGSKNGGTIYEYTISSSAFAVKYNFSFVSGGSLPLGALVEGATGKLYGTTSVGGANGGGTLFEFDAITSTYTTVYEFDAAVTGSTPVGSLVKWTNGKLYGICSVAGVGARGSIFEYDPATHAFQVIYSFSSAQAGNAPTSALLDGKNGILYGTIEANVGGFGMSIYTFDPLSRTVAYAKTTTGADAGTPNALMLSSNGKLYGTTQTGGANGKGFIYEYIPSSNTFTRKFDFTATTGTLYARMTEVNGKLYGATRDGGALNQGTVFEYVPSTNVYTTKFQMVGSTGAVPYSDLLLNTNGKLYGITTYGGSATTFDKRLGVIFEYDPATAVYKAIDLKNGNLSNNSLFQSQFGYHKPQTITFAPIATKVMGGAPFAITATTTSNLAIAFSVASDKVTISGNQVTLAKPGSVTIKADQAGDATFGAATQASQTFCINPAKPIITISFPNTAGVTLSSSSSIGNQWYLDGVAIAGAVTPDYNVKAAGSYTVKATVDNCVSELSASQAMVITGDLTSSEETKMYPNPVRDKLSIQLNDFASGKPVDLIIYDITGRSLETISTEGKSTVVIDVTKYPVGNYVFRAVQSQKSVQKHFVKE